MLGRAGVPAGSQTTMSGVGVPRREPLLVHQRDRLRRDGPEELAGEDEDLSELQGPDVIALA